MLDMNPMVGAVYFGKKRKWICRCRYPRSSPFPKAFLISNYGSKKITPKLK
jgi:hypothetical protein